MTPVERLQSDIVSLDAYMRSLVTEDPEIKSFVLETGNNPFEMERFDSVANSNEFEYPALALQMPLITGEDNEMHNFEAKQELAFCVLYPTDNTHEQKVDALKKSQLACWRILKYLRRDSKAGKFRMDKLFYKMGPFAYGSDHCIGTYVIAMIITNTNSQIGS
jgi:hypothetical protein